MAACLAECVWCFCLPRELARESHAIRNQQKKFDIPFFFHILHTDAAKINIALEDIFCSMKVVMHGALSSGKVMSIQVLDF